jgi:glucose/arabinose dehydrogenase
MRQLTDQSNWDNSCLGAPLPIRGRPGFRLKQQDRHALQTYFSTLAARDKNLGRPRFASFTSMEHQLRELNCRACHSRDDWAERSAGEPEPLAAILRSLAEEEEELAPLIPAMSPPSLNSVGDKLQDEALRDAILRKGTEHRNYLKVMMPKFPLTRERAELLANHFIYHDRVPTAKAKEEPSKADDLILAAGGKLASTEGFGCVSCHQIGKWKPDKAPLNARGPELLMPGKRLRREWFERWVKNPARIVPRMEMPSLQLPVRGVLGNKLDDQIDALWTALNTPGFSPPLPNAVRIVRKTGVKSDNERATVLTDVLEADGKVYIKPFVIALPNRHNLLFDCETGKLVRWWTGDAASQKTRGKSWYWEVIGENKIPDDRKSGIETRAAGGDWLPPVKIGQFVVELDSWQPFREGGVELTYRLQFPQDKGPPAELRVTDQILPLWPTPEDPKGGFSRTVLVKNPKEARVAAIRFSGINDRFEGRNVDGAELYSFHRADPPVPESAPWPTTTNVLAAPVYIAPGWSGTRLPFPEEIMPTALAWRPSGQMLFASLKGNVWQTKDANGDGVPEDATPFSDDLATPYGLAAGDTYVDVATKSAVLRLHGEDTCEQVETIASGWGHTADYHDWVIGLPRDKQGNCYLGIPCQQDKRSPEAAKLRGTVVKLVPRAATPDDPRKFQIEVLTRGHRFPMGLALSRKEALFVTDNQGNYNPFNELNHVRPGAHFGFVNALEKKEDRPVVTPPAIDIPHPWTRSVNGICFLDTPEPIAKERGPVFGPFEGQLVGCEYDTRRLVRLSLQEVDGVYQGAAYPLSLPADNPAEGLLGPVVCAVSPRGELYVGNLRDSGWGGGNNVGDIVRVQFEPEKLPAGIAEVRAEKQGFRVTFTKPIARDKAADIANYRLASYRRESTPAYGGSDQDRRDETLAGVTVAGDGLSVLLKLRELREGFVYEIFVKNLVPGNSLFFPAEAYFTLRKKP